MTIFILTFIIFVLVVAGMAIGVMIANKPIKGSCGGMSALGMNTECEICGGDKNKCEKEQESKTSRSDAESLAYDASKKKSE